jgi:hypothetical protein
VAQAFSPASSGTTRIIAAHDHRHGGAPPDQVRVSPAALLARWSGRGTCGAALFRRASVDRSRLLFSVLILWAAYAYRAYHLDLSFVRRDPPCWPVTSRLRSP